ncbi:MAG TPA: CHAT domain-containing protein [Pyrinomonadaceae bacterium]|nr:CHAT domain-containing protein [Pyrinomonadaceae bacterium]
MKQTLSIFFSLVMVLCASTAFSQGPSVRTARQALDEAQQLVCKGHVDQAFALLTSAADNPENNRDRVAVAEIYLLLAYLYREQNQTQNHLRSLRRAKEQAAGTRHAPLTEAYLSVALAEEASNEDQYLAAVGFLFAFNSQLAKVQRGDQSALLSQALTIRVHLMLEVFDLLDALPASDRAEDLEPLLQILVFSVLKNVESPALREALSTGKSKLNAQELSWLNTQRPFGKKLLEAALDSNTKVTELDQQRGRELENKSSMRPVCGSTASELVHDLEVAKDVSQKGSILFRMGDLDGAIKLKKDALAVFDKYNMFIDAIIVLGHLTHFHLEKDTTDDFLQAFRYSSRAVSQIENQSHAFAGQSIGPFLEQFEDIYELHFIFLLAQYKGLIENSEPAAPQALERFLLHADRMNFRPTRRDLAVYREMAGDLDDSPENALRFERQKKVLKEKRELEQRAKEAGKTKEDYGPATGMKVLDPFTDYEQAKLDLVSILEDFKRRKVGTGSTVRLPNSLAEVRSGMTASEGIVMYVRNTRQNTLSAAVMVGNEPVRYVDLPGVSLSELDQTIENLQDEIVAPSSQGSKSLDNLSRMLWQPLTPLPQNLTIVLIPELLGIPFECLLSRSGKPAVMEHRIQYSFGLAPQLAKPRKLGSVSQVLLAGAESYPGRNLQDLPSSREELEGITRFLKAKGLIVAPENPLLDKGNSIISQRRSFSILHLSTHSDLDSKVPMVDALVFPGDEVYAYDLALSPARADLAVLSACALFKKRLTRSNPVSGITTAMMAGVAPQVISTLWNVDGAATNVFMLRFYSALLEERNPLSALTTAKQDFLEPAKLEAWLKANDIPVPAGIKKYNRPFYWAAFVLTVGLDRADNSVAPRSDQ